MLGGNVNETGRDKAFIKVLAGMLPKVGFDDLWDRYGKDKAEQERKEREEKEKLQIAQSRFVAEKANHLIEDGDSYLARRLSISVLPHEKENPRPFVAEVENVLRSACQKSNTVLLVKSSLFQCAARKRQTADKKPVNLRIHRFFTCIMFFLMRQSPVCMKIVSGIKRAQHCLS